MPLVNAQSPVLTQQAGPGASFPQTYRAAINHTAAAGVAVEIQGSGSATVYITKISFVAGSSTTITTELLSANSTGGTSTGLTATTLDTTSGAASATVLAYTAAPTQGAAVGAVGALTGTTVTYSYDTQPLTLNGAAEAVSISVSGGVAVTGFIEWYEV